MEEIWKPIPGYEELYEASSLGRIRNKYGRVRALREHHKYLTLCMYKKGKKKTIDVHRLIALTFIGPSPGPGYEVDHIDGDRYNNRADNLEYVTKKENYARMAYNQGKLALYAKIEKLEQRVKALEKLLEDKDGER